MHLPWQILILLFVLLIITKALPEKKIKKLDLNEVQYGIREYFFSRAERSFMGVLEGAIGGDFKIFGKVRVSDLVEVKATGPTCAFMAAINSINQKHVDFVICDRKQVKPICVIELDDNSHNSVNAQEKDKLKDRVFSRAGLPLVRFKAKAAYTMADVRANLAPYLENGTGEELPKDVERQIKTGAEAQRLNQVQQQEERQANEIKIPIKEKPIVTVIDMSTGFQENDTPEKFMPKDMRKNA